MSLDTEMPLIIVLACIFLAFFLCAPLFLLHLARVRNETVVEYELLPPMPRRDGQ